MKHNNLLGLLTAVVLVPVLGINASTRAEELKQGTSQSKQIVASTGYYYDGMASWYGPGFHGNRTASGEWFNQYDLTAAHRYLPFGTWVRVTNLNNGRSVEVRINDRGPFTGGRVIDLSTAAAEAIGMINSGVAPVSVEVLR
jgi:rare lipoprotein A